MNDKEMIEKMAKDIVRMAGLGVFEKAEYLINLGYRKLPKDSVVLTSEQYSNYLILQTNEEWLKNKATELQADNERLYNNLAKYKKSVEKETAQEILQTIWKELGIDILSQCYTIPVRTFNKLKRQFSVEVENE